MKSMTGFGRSAVKDAANGVIFKTEIFTVNKKNFEIRVAADRELSGFEPLIRERVSGRITRGMVTVKVMVELFGSALARSVKVNEDLAESLLTKFSALRTKLNLPGEVSISDLLSVPGVVEPKTMAFDSPAIQCSFEKSLEQALDEVVKMRASEGHSLKKDLSERITGLKTILDRLADVAEKLPEQRKNALLDKLEGNGVSTSLNDESLQREIVYIADKYDVSEEITRIRSHFGQFKKYLDNKDEAVGRNLEFLSQELFREITTLGNKALHRDASALVVDFKTEVEKIREQVRNIE